MKQISSFPERLKDVIGDSTITDFADKLGVSKQTISAYLSGIRKPKRLALAEISRTVGVDPAWLMGYDVPRQRSVSDIPPGCEPLPKMRRVPLLGTIACGEPILAEENIEGYCNMPDHIDADFSLRCKGDSMVGAGIHDGDIVFIKKQEDVDNGQVAAVLIGDQATLKRVYKEPNKLFLQPENRAYAPLVYTGEELTTVRIIGLAVACLSAVR